MTADVSRPHPLRSRSSGCRVDALTCTRHEGHLRDGALRAEWDALVLAVPGTDVTQLTAWAAVRATERFVPTYLLVRAGDTLVGGVQVLLRRIGPTRIGYASYGPVVREGPLRSRVVDELSRALAALPGVHMLFVQPAEGGDDVSRGLLARGGRPSTTRIAPEASVRLDLRRSEEEIRRGLSRRLRYWTGHWAERGVTVRHGDVGDVAVLTALMDRTAQIRGFPRPPRADYVQGMFAELSARGHAALFVGEVDGTPVSADLVTMCGTTVRGRLCGFDRTGAGGRLSVPAAVRWEIARWATGEGYRWLDFGGIAASTAEEALREGVRDREHWPPADRTKMAFGGTPFRYPQAVEFVRPAVLRALYDASAGTAAGRRATALATERLRTSPRPHRSAAGGAR